MTKIQTILKNTNYTSNIFVPQEIEVIENLLIENLDSKGNTQYKMKCLVREKEIIVRPEEVIRQLFCYRLLNKYDYPRQRIQLEYPVNFGREIKRADIRIADKDNPDTTYMIIEIKKPNEKDGKEQLKSYVHATGSPISIWTNGQQIIYYTKKHPNHLEEISDVPTNSQKLQDILNAKFYWHDLERINILESQGRTLKQTILGLEDEVLANAGVDVFEEVFKLIFVKLYDEMESGRDNTRPLMFRNFAGTDQEKSNQISGLFQKAKEKWEGIFKKSDKIELTPSHLSICLGSIENVKLFSSNLDVIDDAFEHLINKSSKGEKGQYFTPRYVIDMCVKMMNPKENEYVIDTAAGSAGFTIHSIFHTWQQIQKDEGREITHNFNTTKKSVRQLDYVREKVFAIDFDEKTVRVARTLNLIAGDGETNVLNMNTLDWQRWEERTKNESWQDIYYNGWKKLKRLASNEGHYRNFNFDIVMANPPFAGDIKETTILNPYELSRKSSGKFETKVSRDILFIERNLDFLKDGGRMAVVLPQGRFNNSSDKKIRDYISSKCRILGVVGLHGNTFKPHTGTKTSVLFLQKWDDKLCPKVEDYPIFFATQIKPAKDNSGEKIYLKNPDGTFKLDGNGHEIVDQDLYNDNELTGDGIAEAFVEFGRKEKLSFL
jgi:type I restriction enzyme M protein